MKCPKNIGSITADERRLKQVLLNLIRNAITFTPENGTISITVKKEDTFISLSVADTGPGIPKDDLDRIFEPFERVQSGGRGSGGAGLGLTLVRNIVDLHHGTIKIESEEGKGTDVIVTIPIVQEIDNQDTADAAE